jgi:hypothetical protein
VYLEAKIMAPAGIATQLSERSGKPPPSAAEELLLPDASECEDPDEPATVHSLAEELLLLVLVHARFSSLLALKLVNHQFASLARRSLSEHTEWAVARALCANQQILYLMSGRETDAYEKSLGRGFLTALRKDDTQTVDALLTLRFFRVESPVFCAGDAINRYVATCATSPTALCNTALPHSPFDSLSPLGQSAAPGPFGGDGVAAVPARRVCRRTTRRHADAAYGRVRCRRARRRAGAHRGGRLSNSEPPRPVHVRLHRSVDRTRSLPEQRRVERPRPGHAVARRATRRSGLRRLRQGTAGVVGGCGVLSPSGF